MHRFRSSISVFLLLIVLATLAAIPFLEPGPYFHLPEGEMEIVVSFGVIARVFTLIFGINYEITDTHLRIKLGPIPFGKIAINETRTVERSYIFLSAPAASLKRLLIESDKSSMLISPANEEEFIQVLKSRNPNIKVNVSDKGDWWRFWDWNI
jgi:hypothetical protein